MIFFSSKKSSKLKVFFWMVETPVSAILLVTPKWIWSSQLSFHTYPTIRMKFSKSRRFQNRAMKLLSNRKNRRSAESLRCNSRSFGRRNRIGRTEANVRGSYCRGAQKRPAQNPCTKKETGNDKYYLNFFTSWVHI